jgi:hypothetical protein
MITSISYYELALDLQVIHQETITPTDYDNDDGEEGNTTIEVTFQSITSKLNSTQSLINQVEYVVSTAILVIEGVNDNNETLKNTISWRYTVNQCQDVPIAIGDMLGWTMVHDLQLAEYAFCALVPAGAPTMMVQDVFVKQEEENATTTSSSSSTEAATTTTTEVTTTSATKGSWGSDGWTHNNNNNNNQHAIDNNQHSYGWVWDNEKGWVYISPPTPMDWPTYSPTMSPPTYSPTMKPIWPTYSPTTAADGGGEDSKPTLSGHSSGWAADGWTPPDSHLLGGGGDNVDDSSTNATMMTTYDNTTEIYSNETETSNSTTQSDVVVNASTTSSTTPATTTSTAEDTTTSTEATPAATTTTTEATTTTETTTIAPVTSTTTTEATRPPKGETEPRSDGPKVESLTQEINYLGLENGGATLLTTWFVSSIGCMMAIVLNAILV